MATLGYLLNPTLELYGLGGVAWVRDHLVWTQPGLQLQETICEQQPYPNRL